MSGIGLKLRTVILTGAMFGLVGCAAQYRNHGYVPLEEDLANIVVGVDTRDSVAESVGSPSTGGVLNESGYYYVHSRVKHYAYREPQVIEREVLAVSFDKRGVVSNIERFGLENGNVVPLSRRVTSSNVAEKSFLRQLLGSIGRITPTGFGG